MSPQIKYTAKVGSKGELFPPSKLRRLLGITPGTKVLYYVHNGKLVIEPVLDVLSSLEKIKSLQVYPPRNFAKIVIN